MLRQGPFAFDFLFETSLKNDITEKKAIRIKGSVDKGVENERNEVIEGIRRGPLMDFALLIEAYNPLPIDSYFLI